MTQREVEELLLALQRSAGHLWRLLRFKDEYPGTHSVRGPDGRVLPFEEAISAAMHSLERDLEASGRIHVERELRHLEGRKKER